MRRLIPILGTLAAAIAMATCATVPPSIARAQGAHEGHATFHDVYSKWMRPHQPHVPCCSARRTIGGETTGDCYPTSAEPRPSQKPELKGAVVWWALKADGAWVEIPEDRHVRYANPDETGDRAHLCESYGMIHCFRQSSAGY